MSERGFARFLAESFTALQRELPAAHAALCRCLASRAVRIEVGAERLGVQVGDGHVRVLADAAQPAIEVLTSKAAVLDLIDARCSLMDAVLSDRLLLRGAPGALLAFHDALLCYIHGAVRAPSFPDLLRAYRSESPAPVRREEGR